MKNQAIVKNEVKEIGYFENDFYRISKTPSVEKIMIKLKVKGKVILVVI